MSLPEYCGATPGSEEYQDAELYWRGINYSWEDLHQILRGRQGVKRIVKGNRSFHASPKHIGLFPYTSGLVVIDCDVKHVYRAVRPSVKTPLGPVFGTIGVVVRKGIEDLAQLCSSLGHDLSELATYTVRTKSGGLHLYFWNNFETPLTTTTRHRENWCIDVIVSKNNWVAAPPTPGYTVVCDYPVATMPDWLAETLQALHERFDPKGGKKRIANEDRLTEARRQVFHGNTVRVGTDKGLLGEWVAASLKIIRDASDDGYWGLTLWRVAKDFAKAGWSYEAVQETLLIAADPWDAKNERLAIANIRAGYRSAGRDN